MSKVLLATDILSEIYKGVDEIVSQNARKYLAEHGQLSFSSVSVHEVLYGYHANDAASRAQKFLLVVSRSRGNHAVGPRLPAGGGNSGRPETGRNAHRSL